MRIMALDVGEQRIGIAISDPSGIIAKPFTIISCQGVMVDIQTIAKLTREQEVSRIIVGLPLLPDGRQGTQSEKVRQFTEKLADVLTVPLELCDERFSTVTAREHRLESGVGKKKRRAPDDAVAAAVILQSYLDEAYAQGNLGYRPVL